jgi:hypothetical protein
MPLPLEWKPDRGSADSYIRIREQARIVVEARTAGTREFEPLPVETGFGLTRLPESSDGDVFLDLEGDPFVGEHGLEYLFGYLFKDGHGAPVYEGDWASRALTRSAPSRHSSISSWHAGRSFLACTSTTTPLTSQRP